MSDDDDAELIRRAEARVGTKLKDKWTIDRLLGVGGMAVVYAATHRNKKRVAIKMLHPELSIDPDIKARFLREGYVANTVDHPGAVMVDDDDVGEDGAAFIVMELLEGETVQGRLERKGGRLPVDEVLSIASQLLDVLAAAHDKGIVHRDLKPENVFLDKSGQVKVLDFGIARLREGRERSGTRTGSLMGTPSYMPPEQARGRWDEVDARSDLWAVGATMYTLLTGHLVHEAEMANEALALAITQRAPLLSSVMPEVPESVAAVVDCALSYEKEARYPDAASMQLAVRHAYAELHDASASGRMPALSIPDARPGGTISLPGPTPAATGQTAPGIADAAANVALASGAPDAVVAPAAPGTDGAPLPPGSEQVAVAASAPAMQAVTAAVSPTTAGMTRSAPGSLAKKLPVVPVAIAAGAGFIALVGIIIAIVVVHSYSSAAAAASAPAASALTHVAPEASAKPVAAPAVTPAPDDQGAINVDDLPSVEKKKPNPVASATHHVVEKHKVVAAEKPRRKPATEHPHHRVPKVVDDPFARRR